MQEVYAANLNGYIRVQLRQRVLTFEVLLFSHFSSFQNIIYLGMTTAIGRGLRDLLVDDDIDANTLFGLALQKPVKTPLRVRGGRTTEVQFGTEPPVEDEDALPGGINELADRIEVI